MFTGGMRGSAEGICVEQQAQKEAIHREVKKDNVGTGVRTTLNQSLKLLEKISGQPLRARYDPPRAGDIRHSQADIGFARRLLHYEPRVEFEEGLRLTWEWCRACARDL